MSHENDPFILALEALRPFLLRYISQFNKESAEDIAQESTLKAYTAYKAGKFDGENLQGWLCTIARNTAMNHHAKENRQIKGVNVVPLDGQSMEEAIDFHAVDHAPSAEDVVINDTLNHKLATALNTIKPEFAQTLTLYAEGHSYEEIAEIMGCASGTVMSRLNRARRDMKAQLA